MDGLTKDALLLNNERIRCLKILLLDHLTPLLRKEIRHAITLHSDAPEHGQTLKDIDVLYDRITRRWAMIYGTPISRASTLQDIGLFQQFLTAALLEEYAQEPYTVTQWVSGQATIIKQHYARVEVDGDDDSTYQVHIAFPLEELMLNKDHVENKVISVATKQRPATQRFIDGNDWSGLAVTLAKDRDLALSLFGEKPFYPHVFDGDPGKKVLQGIDKIQGNYLAKLNSSIPTSRTNASELPARQASNFWSSLTPLIHTPSNTNPRALLRKGTRFGE